jgi:exopolysaccharide production protein ExoZ
MTAKLHTIQYLRAIAAMLVLASHALLYPIAEHTLAYGRLGWLGVILFFVVSGFIMVAVTGTGRFDAGKFLRRRVLRIVPMYWAFTFLAAALAIILPSLFKTTVFDLMQLVESLFFVPFYNPASQGLHPLYKLGWTLNYEMFFYFSFALLALLKARHRVIALTLIYCSLTAVGALLHPTGAIAGFYTSYMPLAFVAGAWLGLAQVEGWLRNTHWSVGVALVVLCLGGLVEGFMIDRGVVEDWEAFAGMLVAAASLVALAVAFEPALPRLRVLELLGDASYSIYLVHIFAVAGIAGVALRMIGPASPLAMWASIVAAILGGLLIGVILYRLVEAPLTERLRRLA